MSIICFAIEKHTKKHTENDFTVTEVKELVCRLYFEDEDDYGKKF